MVKQNFKFLVRTTKYGNSKTVNVKAYSKDEAINIMRDSSTTKLLLTYTVMIYPEYDVIADFDFNYDSDTYKNYINSL